MNSLKREIQEGEVVVIKASVLRPEFQALDERLFVCKHGYGMSHETRGTAIWGAYLKDADECRHEGTEIDPDETAEYQRTHVHNINSV